MSSNPPRGSSRRRIAGERRPSPARGDATGPEAPGATEAPGTAAGPVTDPGTDRRDQPTYVAPPPTADQPPVTEEPGQRDRRPRGTGPSVLVLGILGVLALALVVAAVVLGTFVWSYGQVRHGDQVAEAGRTATAAAERAAVPILSYDYRSLPADQKAAEKFMTPTYRKQYDASFTKLVEPNAPRLHARVSASVKASGVMLPASPNRVDVLVYVNQSTTSTANGGDPQVALNRAKFSMVRSGGTWRVNGIVAY